MYSLLTNTKDEQPTAKDESHFSTSEQAVLTHGGMATHVTITGR